MRISTPVSWLFLGPALVSAHLLVAKNYATPHIVAGEPIEVSYEFYNQGNDPVKNIELVDASFLPPSEDKAVFRMLPEDTYPLRLAELKGGARHTFKLRLEPLTVGSFPDAPAVIEYERPIAKTELSTDGVEKVVVYSTGRGLLRVISKLEYVTTVKGHRREWSIFLLGALLLTCLPYIRYRQLTRQVARVGSTVDNGSSNGQGKNSAIPVGRGQAQGGGPKRDKKK